MVAVAADFLRDLYVVPENWGQGVGSSLHDRALTSLRQRSCRRARLWVLDQNHVARLFYEKRVWAQSGETRVAPMAPNPVEVGYFIELTG